MDSYEFTNCDDVIDTFLGCKFKAYHLLNGDQIAPSDFELLRHETKESLFLKFTRQIHSNYPISQIYYHSIPEIGNINSQVIVFNPDIRIMGYKVNIDALEIFPSDSSHSIVPIIISDAEKISKRMKLSLSTKSLLLEQQLNLIAEKGKIIHEQNLRLMTISLKSLKKESEKILEEIQELINKKQLPSFWKTPHCRICGFEEGCKKTLIERDDLSLLGGISPKEAFRRVRNGICTISQLSCCYRPRRIPKKRRMKPKYSFELKALALRDSKTYILETPKIPIREKYVYLDFEGLSDENFIYLIGMIIKENNSERRISLWADKREQEREIFEKFLNILSCYDDFILFHYGSYEVSEMKRITDAHPELDRNQINRVLDNSVDLLSYFHSMVYIPTYTNELKDIARFLGFNWADAKSSGIQSIVWRKRWEITGDSQYKLSLMHYNLDDCTALIIIEEWLRSIALGLESESARIAHVKAIESQWPIKYGKTAFLISEFEAINNCAYFSYQRDKVLLKTNPNIQRAVKKETAKKRIRKKPRSARYRQTPCPKACPRCGHDKFYVHGKRKKMLIDLQFRTSGIRKCVTEYEARRFRCRKCKFVSRFEKSGASTGENVYLWALNQYVSYKTSFRSISQMLDEYFRIPVTAASIQRYKGIMAERYEETCNEIIKNQISGQLLQADETKIRVGGFPGYVWVFANVDSVFYLYKQTREAFFLKEFLQEFKGVLVSDFYSAYDSLKCPQQKCLVHLIRDLNDDLFRCQFDFEFKQMVSDFGGLLKNIIDTVHKYGLKKFRLARHKKEVEAFFLHIFNSEYNSKLAQKYQLRLNKYKNKLFTFLDYDEVPWNNNLAEHAIKHLARYRRNVDGSFSEKGLREYLVLLSIYQTCKYNGLNFFQFLLSKEKSVFQYRKIIYRLRH